MMGDQCLMQLVVYAPRSFSKKLHVQARLFMHTSTHVTISFKNSTGVTCEL